MQLKINLYIEEGIDISQNDLWNKNFEEFKNELKELEINNVNLTEIIIDPKSLDAISDIEETDKKYFYPNKYVAFLNLLKTDSKLDFNIFLFKKRSNLILKHLYGAYALRCEMKYLKKGEKIILMLDEYADYKDGGTLYHEFLHFALDSAHRDAEQGFKPNWLSNLNFKKEYIDGDEEQIKEFLLQ